MQRLIALACVLAAGGTMALTLLTQAAEPVKPQPTELMTTPLTGDPSREVKVLNVQLPPGADSGWHHHPGDQYTTVQEGEIQVAVDGKGTQDLKAGQALHIDPMVAHRTQNLSGKPARTTEVFLVQKGKPLSEPATPTQTSSSTR